MRLGVRKLKTSRRRPIIATSRSFVMPAPASAATQRTPLATALEDVVVGRRSVYAYLETAVPAATLEWAIGLASLAPNHHKTKPWRFFVLAGEARELLAAAYESAAIRLGRDVVKARGRAFDAPVMIVLACVHAPGHPKAKPNEDEFATAAAAQTLMLALASAGVATLLTTGDLAESREVHDLVELDSAQGRVMGVINAGLRDPKRPLMPRAAQDAAAITRWLVKK
jgi:nitroreductase